MLATASYPSQPFMYNSFNNRHAMHTSSPVQYSSSVPSQMDHPLDYTNNWSDGGPQSRYVAGSNNGFVNDVPKTMNHSNVFPSSSQGVNSRSQTYYAPSERSTYEQWSSSSISPHSPQSLHTPSLSSAGGSGELYHGAGFRQFGHHPGQEWNQPWPENSSSNVMDTIRTGNSTSHWPNNDLRVGPFSPPVLDNLLLTSATNSPAYSVATELPPVAPTRGYEMSPISSPSPSPSVASRRLSPNSAASPPSSRRASVDGSASGKKCSHCNATSTPLWRREPTTLKPLCNACGLYLQQRHRHRPKELIDADQEDDESEEEDQNYNGPECSHCHTHRTSVWRRSKTGAQLCNACGVYARLRGKDRPLSLKRKKIKPRTKHASTSTAKAP
ncbi:GATA-binding factor 5-A [Leucoagaricus sp. SymC.cos]|nr:GATA-binding factor 5-A [Leucoagaricus sp. SymC.cos]